MLTGHVSPDISPAIYVIPIPTAEPEKKVALALQPAWKNIPPTARDQDTLDSLQHILPSVNRKNSLPKCCSCSRGHKVGVDVPKCCAFGIAEEHLFEHFFDDSVFNTNSCECSISTLSEVLPKLASQTSNTSSKPSSNIEE